VKEPLLLLFQLLFRAPAAVAQKTTTPVTQIKPVNKAPTAQAAPKKSWFDYVLNRVSQTQVQLKK